MRRYYKDKFGKLIKHNDYVIVYWIDYYPEVYQIDTIDTIDTVEKIYGYSDEYHIRFMADEHCYYNTADVNFDRIYKINKNSIERLPFFRKKREQRILLLQLERGNSYDGE